MIEQEVIDLLMPTGRGTPCGDLMRRYWQPAALSEELALDKPLPAQLFGEELILFRDGDGKPALIGRYCAHQGVDMIYGQVEPDGLRCLYHGWLFDNCGKVVLRGDWLPEKERRWDVGQPAYRCIEQAGIIFTYMAKGELPAPPIEESILQSSDWRVPTREICAGNYLQGMSDPSQSGSSAAAFLLPNIMTSPARHDEDAHWLRWHVPVDDHSYVAYTLRYGGAPQFNGEPSDGLRRSLLEATEAVRSEQLTAAVQTSKDY